MRSAARRAASSWSWLTPTPRPCPSLPDRRPTSAGSIAVDADAAPLPARRTTRNCATRSSAAGRRLRRTGLIAAARATSASAWTPSALLITPSGAAQGELDGRTSSSVVSAAPGASAGRRRELGRRDPPRGLCGAPDVHGGRPRPPARGDGADARWRDSGSRRAAGDGAVPRRGCRSCRSASPGSADLAGRGRGGARRGARRRSRSRCCWSATGRWRSDERRGAIDQAVDRLELVEVLCRTWRDALLIRAAAHDGVVGRGVADYSSTAEPRPRAPPA